MLPKWEALVTVRQTSAGSDPKTFQPGVDLVLEMPRAHGQELAYGVLLDDWLSPSDRKAIDAEALARLTDFRMRRDGQLTLDGVCLPWIWELDLLTDVFLPEVRIVSGLVAAFGHSRAPRRVATVGLGGARLACVITAVRALGITAAVTEATLPDTARHWRARPLPRTYRAARSLLRTIGLPSRIRGSAYVLPYWHLRPVFERLATSSKATSVVDTINEPPTSIRLSVVAALRGGWVGHPNVANLRASTRRVRSSIAGLRVETGSDSVVDLLDNRALDLIASRGAETLAFVDQLRSAFRSPQLRVAVLPFDSPPRARWAVQAARDCGLPVLVIQHGFAAEPNDPDKQLADVVAVWSEADAETLRKRVSGSVVVTGNPAAVGVAAKAPAGDGHALILVEEPTVLSVRLDSRVSIRHVNAALRVLDELRPGTTATIRPHPGHNEPDVFLDSVKAARRIDVRVDAVSPIRELIARSDLCIGSISTATLEAAASGVPTIVLSMASVAPWPLDGSTALPVARDPDELSALVVGALQADSGPTKEVAARALGALPGSMDRVVALIEALVEGSGADRLLSDAAR